MHYAFWITRSVYLYSISSKHTRHTSIKKIIISPPFLLVFVILKSHQTIMLLVNSKLASSRTFYVNQQSLNIQCKKSKTSFFFLVCQPRANPTNITMFYNFTTGRTLNLYVTTRENKIQVLLCFVTGMI